VEFDESVPVVDWWESAHQEASLKWLTGSQGPEVWDYLQVADRVRPGATVLNIGIGLGHCTRKLAARGCRVHALDIAEAALAHVQDVVVGSWLARDLASLPRDTMDLAISNLVAQHMDDAALRAQLAAVIPSLKVGGVFALQFAYGFDAWDNDLEHRELSHSKGGGELRSLGHLSKMVETAGGIVVWASRLSDYPQVRAGWYGVHIVRRDYPWPNTSLEASKRNLPQDREAFLLEVEAPWERWQPVLTAFTQAFGPGDPVALLLAVAAPEPALAAWLAASCLPGGPDLRLVTGPQELVESLRAFPTVQRVRTGLQGPLGLRFAQALQSASPS
jgi:hypothetical protein